MQRQREREGICFANGKLIFIRSFANESGNRLTGRGSKTGKQESMQVGMTTLLASSISITREGRKDARLRCTRCDMRRWMSDFSTSLRVQSLSLSLSLRRRRCPCRRRRRRRRRYAHFAVPSTLEESAKTRLHRLLSLSHTGTHTFRVYVYINEGVRVCLRVCVVRMCVSDSAAAADARRALTSKCRSCSRSDCLAATATAATDVRFPSLTLAAVSSSFFLLDRCIRRNRLLWSRLWSLCQAVSP